MNAKKAKALRKLVRNLQKTQGELPEHAFVKVKGTDKHMMVHVDELPKDEVAQTEDDVVVHKTEATADEQPTPSMKVEKVTLFEGQVRVAPRSQRAVYLHLKKELEKVEDARRAK